MTQAIVAPQKTDALWHEIKSLCPQQHELSTMKVEVSRFGNLRMKMVCVTCGKRYLNIQSVISLLNESSQLDMLAFSEEGLPVLSQLEEMVTQ